MTSTATETTIARTFTCRGSVRGDCGHVHESLAEAMRCCDADNAAIHAAHPHSGLTTPYSDRRPVQTSGPRMDDWDRIQAIEAMD